MSGFTVDPRLDADCATIGDLPFSRVLLMDDARFPWLVVVPRICGARELIDLDASDRNALFADVDRVARALEARVGPDKLNVAALGNVVAQLHVHVIARFRSDAAWPRPVWGVGETLHHADDARRAEVAAWRRALAIEPDAPA
jgi:diadenosine tetraphosphate (Ap4A) HIT family hydrolase